MVGFLILFELSPFINRGSGVFFGTSVEYPYSISFLAGCETSFPCKKRTIGIDAKFMLEFENLEEMPEIMEEILFQLTRKRNYAVGFWGVLKMVSFKMAGLSFGRIYRNLSYFLFLAHEKFGDDMAGVVGVGSRMYYARLLNTEIYVGYSKKRGKEEWKLFLSFKTGFLR